MLDTSVEYLKGIGAFKAQTLQNELAIYTFEHLMNHYPFRYVDKTKFTQIIDVVSEDEFVQIRGVLRSTEEQGEGSKRRLVAILRDPTGYIKLVWFKQFKWIQDIAVGTECIVYGKPTLYNGEASLTHPELKISSVGNTEKASTMEPVYGTTEKLKAKGLDSGGIWRTMRTLFEKLHPQRQLIRETLSEELIQQLRFPSRYEAILYTHFPKTQAQCDACRHRLKFEEFFFLQLRMLQGKVLRKRGQAGLVFSKIGAYVNTFYQSGLQFDLTNAQKRVLREIRTDLGNGLQMNRLLQGDVGSGKTVVGFMAMLIALDNDFQAALIAPTEILAQQHFRSIAELATPLGVRVSLLTGNVKGKARKGVLHLLETGEVQIIIGTHAILEDKVKFKNLGLAIIDEQHRFGVAQRAKMWAKNELAPPHILVMTATPIPRTLAMTVYGDLDVSVIDEMPPGRKPITTYHKYESQRLWVFGLIKREIDAGRQVYIVYPLIEESESETLADIKNLMEGAEAIERAFPKPQYQISIVHGRQDPEDKHFEMHRFIRKETQIMVATTVIEVGVNVPNATLMLIENAERFGLAQLHQLRGRVGRGGGDSYCILMTGFKLSKDSQFRMQVMCETTDGFKISEADLKLRGPGNLEGTQQSGILNLKIADLLQDTHILQTARHFAETILEEDPELALPKNLPMKIRLEETRRSLGYGKIS